MHIACEARTFTYVSDDIGQQILSRLIGTDDSLLGAPRVVRTGPAQRRPWFGSLRLTRVPVEVQQPRGRANGHIDVQSVGAGTTEVRIWLRATSPWQRLFARRLLDRTAEEVLNALTYKQAVGPTRVVQGVSAAQLSRAAARGTTQSCA